MYEKILVVDDDFGTVKLIETILKNNNYTPVCFTSSIDALNSFNKNQYDLILSDYFMPELNGKDFLEKVRKVDKYIPFMILTVNNDIENAIELLKMGADDYINKPVNKDELIFRISKNIKEKENKKIIDRIEKEKEILALENKRIVNWKLLYASKDVKQTEQVINLFTRTLNQDGSLIWLDILKNSIQKIDEKYYKVKASLVDLIIKSTEKNQQFFENITFISNLDSMELTYNSFEYNDFVENIKKFVKEDLKFLKDKYERDFLVEESNYKLDCLINLDINYFQKIIKELIINGIKYSPPKTNIYLIIEKNKKQDKYIDISIKNTPRKMDAKDLENNDIIGIPYEYSELVFDLFYTIEAFPTTLEEEEWKNGTGLYIARKLLKRFSGWISTANGIDYSRGEPQPYVKFTISLPYKEKNTILK